MHAPSQTPKRDATATRANSALILLAIFLSGAVSFGVTRKISEQERYATFLRHCPNLDIDNHFAFRTSEGRIVIVSFLDVPEWQLPAFCPDPKALSSDPPAH